MNYNTIGDFITNQRQYNGLTQSELAEKLGISLKTLEKWENGKELPKSNILPKLCEVFDITINELLNCEKFTNTEYFNKAEKQLLELQKTNENLTKKIITAEICVCITGILIFLASMAISFYMACATPLYTLSVIIILTGTIILTICCFICTYLDQQIGYYICENCGHKYTPSLTKSILSPRMHRTLYMQCPHCHQKS